MSELLKNAFNPENFREQAHLLVELLFDHLKNTINGNDPKALPWEDPEKKYQYWKDFLNDKSKDNTHFIRI